MANNRDDYLTEYREFFERFAQTVNPKEQLPVKLGSYKFLNIEVVGGIIDWTTQYLTEKQCPKQLLYPLINIIIGEVRRTCKQHPISCGFNPTDDAYEPLKLMQSVITKTNEICLRYLDNSVLCSLPSPGPPFHPISCSAIRNARRRMEDRHVIIHDLNAIFNKQEASPSSYYAVFDGHAGHDAAAYSAAHLHQYLAESKHFATNPEQALIDAFCKTDALFNEKCKVENFNGGTTAVCALLRPKEKTLYIAWVGDSQAALVKQGQTLQCVNPHLASREDEKNRIEEMGGYVLFWGMWRVNGQLAVSRAIGDSEYKPYVIAVPDVREICLTGAEDFLIVACDGLWDFLSEGDAALLVYKMVYENPDDIEHISQRLVQEAKVLGSSDNISAIVVFLREPHRIAADQQLLHLHQQKQQSVTDKMESTLDTAAAANPFLANAPELQKDKDPFLLNLNGTSTIDVDFFYDKNGTKPVVAGEFDDDDDDEDFGPETDVDAVDDVLTSPVKISAEANPFNETEKKVAMEIDLNFQKNDNEMLDDFMKSAHRDETPTPPADEVHEVVGLVDNVAESDSEDDEWNYFKGENNKENHDPLSSASPQPEQEVAETAPAETVAVEDSHQEGEENEMTSQLNPNAAEFVPGSPENIASALSSMATRAIRAEDDPVLARSPLRGNNGLVVNVAELPSDVNDFESEMRSRPSDITNTNGIQNSNKATSQELMENLLNSSPQLDEDIKFNKGPTTPVKTAHNDEFHFGPNAAPFSTKFSEPSQQEQIIALNVEDNKYAEEDNTDFIRASSKEQDPMSMSFYQEKEDLNKVQELPDDLDDFLSNKDLFVKQPIETTDLDRRDDLLGVCELPKSPEPSDLSENLTESPVDPECPFVLKQCELPVVDKEDVSDVTSSLKDGDLLSPVESEDLLREDKPDESPEVSNADEILDAVEKDLSEPLVDEELCTVVDNKDDEVKEGTITDVDTVGAERPVQDEVKVLDVQQHIDEVKDHHQEQIEANLDSPLEESIEHSEPIKTPEPLSEIQHEAEPIKTPEPAETIIQDEPIETPEPESEPFEQPKEEIELPVAQPKEQIELPATQLVEEIELPVAHPDEHIESPVAQPDEEIEVSAEKPKEEIELPAEKPKEEIEPTVVHVEQSLTVECQIEPAASPAIVSPIESPCEDVTTSVKDDEPLSPVEPAEELPKEEVPEEPLKYAQQLSDAVEENVTSETSAPLESGDASKKDDLIVVDDQPEPIVEAIEEQLCNLDIQPTPLIPTLTNDTANEIDVVQEKVEVAHDLVAPVPTEAEPLPVAKEDISVEQILPAPVTETPTEELKPVEEPSAPEPSAINDTAVAAAAAAAVAATAAVAVTASTTAIKKPTTKTSTTPKSSTAKTGVTAAAKKSSTTKSATTTAAKTSSTLKATPPPKSKPAPITRITPTAKPAASKLNTSQTNGVAKPSATAAKKPAAAATCPMKPATKQPTATSARTLASKPPPAQRTTTTSTTTAPAKKPAPITRISSSTAKTATKTETTVNKTTTAAKPAAPRTRPATAPTSTTNTTAKPRVPLSQRSTTTKPTPDSEKQNKENVNKLTAQRSATATKTSTNTTRKVDVKNSTTAIKKTSTAMNGKLSDGKRLGDKTSSKVTKAAPGAAAKTAAVPIIEQVAAVNGSE